MCSSDLVAFMFDRAGIVRLKTDVGSADVVFEAALEAGAEDVQSDDDGHEITCNPDDFAAVRDALEEKFGEPMSARLDWKPNITTELDESGAESILKFIDVLEDNDDVQRVASNFEVSDEVLAKLSG